MKIKRNRAWRRFKKKVNSKKVTEYPGKTPQDSWKGDKNWKLLGRRFDKIKRAQQLGFEYPKIPISQTIVNVSDTDE